MNEYTSQSQVSKCYVYVIQSGNGPVKIGVADDHSLIHSGARL